MNNGATEDRRRDIVKHNLEELWLTVEDVEDRAEWRRRTCVADPSPEEFTAWRKKKREERSISH